MPKSWLKKEERLEDQSRGPQVESWVRKAALCRTRLNLGAEAEPGQ